MPGALNVGGVDRSMSVALDAESIDASLPDSPLEPPPLPRTALLTPRDSTKAHATGPRSSPGKMGSVAAFGFAGVLGYTSVVAKRDSLLVQVLSGTADAKVPFDGP